MDQKSKIFINNGIYHQDRIQRGEGDSSPFKKNYNILIGINGYPTAKYYDLILSEIYY